MPTSPAALADRIGMVAGPLAIILLIVWLSGWTGPDSPSAALAAVETLSRAAPIAGLWLIAAVGYGWPLRRWLLRGPRGEARDATLLQIVCGIALLLWLDATLAATGLLFMGGALAAWIVLAIGLGLLLIQTALHLRPQQQYSLRIAWLWWLAAPAMATLLVATTSAPGWLWSSEFGGYDGLSYHLQLPREWIDLGRAAPLEHNVYSFLPGYVEAAYAHLMLLRSDPYHAAYAAQLLHACIALLCAIIVARCVHRLLRTPLMPLAVSAGILFLATPWVIVVGSLAYNELFICLMLAGGLLVLLDRALPGWRSGILIGLLAGAACGAKLTAIGFVALPLVLLLIAQFRTNRRALLLSLLYGALAGICMLSPWLMRNWHACGNPTFPFFTNVFGSGHWSAEQVGAWQAGHSAAHSPSGRVVEGFNQLFRYGIGPNPDPTGHEPWIAQWSALPWLGLIGCALGMISPRTRRWSFLLLLIIAIQLFFWLSMTHIKSRFMLPMAVPASIGAMLGLAALLFHLQSMRRALLRSFRPVLALIAIALLLAWCAVPTVLFLRERDAQPSAFLGQHQLFTGAAMSAAERVQVGMHVSPAIHINHLLMDGDRVLLLGEATPYYYDLRRITYHTTWDRGPMSEILRAEPDDPNVWFSTLRERGYTHVLINATMLDLWRQAGWSDPMLDATRMLAEADAHTRLLAQYPGGVRLYALR